MANRVINPLIASRVITPEEEKEELLQTNEEIESLATMMKELSQLRQVVALEARKTDLGHIVKIDAIATSLLDIVVKNSEKIQEAMEKALKGGSMRALKDIAQSIQMLMEVRESLLGFDETRHMQGKRKMRLQVVWKGTDGSSGGINVEA